MRTPSQSSSEMLVLYVRRIVANTGRKRNFSGKNSRKSRPKLKATAVDANATWYSSARVKPSSLDMGRYGLKRLDYRTMEPPVWTIPPHPPTKSTTDRVVFPITLLTIGSIIAWAYLNPEDDDMKDYWKRVETGEILYEDDDDDDDDDDHDEY